MPATAALSDVTVHKAFLSKTMITLIRPALRLYLCLFIGMAKVRIENGERLFKLFNRSLRGESRSIILFRHPYGNEPQLLMWYVLFKMKKAAARAGVMLPPGRPHLRILYGYEVLRWGGPLARFALPRVAALPVYHAKVDSESMNAIINALSEGPYPLALAPEGQVSYTADALPRLESGGVRIGFQAARHLAEKNIPVELLPLSIHYRYAPSAEKKMERLLQEIEHICGWSTESQAWKERIERCREHLLELNEKRYKIEADSNAEYQTRVEAVMEAAMERTRQILDTHDHGGDVFARMYFLRQICWDRIFVPGMSSLNGMPPLERSLADLRAGEAWHAARHLEMVDFLWYFRGPIPDASAPLHTRIEYVQNLYDFSNRTRGGAFSNRRTLHPKEVLWVAAEAISLSEDLEVFKQDKKTATARVMHKLEQAFLEGL
jgi:hypothetical protein